MNENTMDSVKPDFDYKMLYEIGLRESRELREQVRTLEAKLKEQEDRMLDLENQVDFKRMDIQTLEEELAALSEKNARLAGIADGLKYAMNIYERGAEPEEVAL